MSVVSFEAKEFQFLEELFDIAPTRAEIRSWPKELKNQRKLQLHCHRTIRYRHKKEVERKNMHDEYQRLGRELEQRLVDLSHRGVCVGDGSLNQVQREMQRLVLEREALREENVTLRQKITQHQKFLRTTQSARTQVIPRPSETDFKFEPASVTVRCIDSQWQPVEEQAGHRVYFPHGRPSFFFHPFTRQEFDAIIGQHDLKTSSDSSQLTSTGQHLGWNVYHGIVNNFHGVPRLLGHIRCTKRVERSMDSILSCIKKDDGTSKWAIMPIASDIGTSAVINVQTLQRLDDDNYVIVRDYAGAAKFRYMCLVQQSKIQQINGKRVAKFHYAAGDSKANSRTRDIEFATEDKVSWITEEAGYSLTLVERHLAAPGDSFSNPRRASHPSIPHSRHEVTLGLVVVAVAVASAAAAGDNCSFRCLDVYKPVCGSNGETYSNSCHLRLASCQSKNEITEASDGECASTPATSTTGSTADTGGCPDVCPDVYDPVSDENGVQYSNQCYMEVAKCNDVGDEGINGYENPDLDPQRKLMFAPGYKDSLCHDMECPDNYAPVCGSDGVTYSNECNLSITNCNHPEQNITIIGDGACSNKQQQQS